MFKIVKNMDDLLKAYTVRAVVFIGEQNCTFDEEVDEFEYSAVHILGEKNGEPIAAGRLRFPGQYAKLERISIRKEWRGSGLGHQLVDFMIDEAKRRGFTTFKMHAQAHLTDFYAEHGFVKQGELFQEANIDHYLMVRQD